MTSISVNKSTEIQVKKTIEESHSYSYPTTLSKKEIIIKPESMKKYDGTDKGVQKYGLLGGS